MTQPTFTIRKVEAAQRQVDTAIRLWFADAEPVSIHTLACAAHQIVHDINADRGGEGLLFDSDVIKDEFRIEFQREMKKAPNFFKHADRDPDPEGVVELNQRVTELFILFAIIGLERLGCAHSWYMFAFTMFYAIMNPRLVTKHFSNRVNVEDLASLRSVTKVEFLEQIQIAKSQANNIKP